MTTAQNPVIILVRPQLGENIGKAARAMLNFGLTEMRLVAPRDGWPNPDAGPSASGADQILEEAVVYDSLAEAAHDRTHLYATTVRKRGVTKQVLTPTEAAQEIHGLKTTMPDARPAFVFGPERSGLDSADVTLCRSIITVPVNPEFGSLNLAQAVILLSYQWAMLAGQDGVDAGAVDMPPPAPQEELEGLINALNDALAKRGYFFPPERTEATQRTLRNILTRPAWSSQEIRTLRGVVTNLDKK